MWECPNSLALARTDYYPSKNGLKGGNVNVILISIFVSLTIDEEEYFFWTESPLSCLLNAFGPLIIDLHELMVSSGY